MNDDIVYRWNLIVGEDDRVLVLGDVVMGRVEESLRYVHLLNGIKTLLPGNHDKCWHGHRKVGIWTQKYLDAGFAKILSDEHEPLVGMIGDAKVRFSHFPYHNADGTDLRYQSLRPVDDGHTWLIHGHVHEKWRQRGRQINVGIDAWGGYPVSVASLEHIIRQGEDYDSERMEW